MNTYIADIENQLKQYEPFNEQETCDKELILDYLNEPNILTRENEKAHITVSGWTVNDDRTKTVMCYHKIYDSWSWLGGHADGNCNLLEVAMKEVREEAGLTELRPITKDIFSIEILTVDGHEKKGKYIPSHLHINFTFILEAKETEKLKICEAENSGVKWFELEDALNASSEAWIRDRIYRKLIEKTKLL